jgi:DNA-directed RNA polymerase specialized sigma24 family protein
MRRSRKSAGTLSRFEKVVLPRLSPLATLRPAYRHSETTEDLVQERVCAHLSFGWTFGATIREVLVLRHADQELINRALDRLPVEFCEVMVLRELFNTTDLKKLSADINKLEDVETSSSRIPR